MSDDRESAGGDDRYEESEGRASEVGGGQGVPTGEKIVIVASVLFTAGLFGFAAWQATTGAGAAAPEVGAIGHSTAPDGQVVYTVELRNPGDIGLVQATVTAGCTDPPTQLTFENVPAGGRRTGTIVCPPGTTDPRVSIDSWIPE